MTTEVKEYTVRVRPTESGWSVDIVTSDGRSLVPVRQLRRVTVALSVEWIFPQISTEEQQGPGDIPELCRGDEPRPIVREYYRIATSTPSEQSAENMGRYLFRLLFGPDGFDRIRADAGEHSIKLLLDWDASQYLLTRLPWEMLHDGNHFLAAGNGHLIAIVRQVDAGDQAATSLVAPRVLFVVGSRLKDPEVRPGAEYLGLLRRLQTLHLAMDSRVLVEATGDMLRDEILAFRPSIVHFICHGSFNGARGVLNLIDHESSAGHGATFAADQLLGLLSPVQTNGQKALLPAVVVLTACYSATQPQIDNEEDPFPPTVVGSSSGSLPTTDVQPLAAQLVHGGIPMVVGMGGKVADLACRLFTRMFYESLIKIDDDPVMAAARGRCNGYLLTENPSRSVDWAFPTVFVAKGSRLHRNQQLMKTAMVRATAASAFGTTNDPRAFCDRLPYLRAFHELANFQTDARSRILCVYQSTHVDEAARYGRTRLLHALCMEAVRMGHFPCLVSIPESDAAPTTPIIVGKAVRLAMMNTWRRFFGDDHEIADEAFELDKLEQGRTDQAHEEVKRAIKNYGAEDPRTVVAAIQVDAAMLREKAWELLYPDSDSPNDMRVIIYFDDVHRFGQKLASALVTQMLDQGGFGTKGQPIPVVFTFKKDQKHQGGFEVLYKYVSDRPPGLTAMELKPLAAPEEDPTIYSHYLLEGAWVWNSGVIDNIPLVARNPDEVFKTLHPWIMGQPANFERQNDRLAVAVAVSMSYQHLTRARDDDVLAGVGARG